MADKEKLEKIKKLADAMYYAAQYLTTDASRLHKAIDEYHKFIINEYHKEEYSEDLEEFINTIKLLTSNTALLTFEYGCREGAKWQKEKDAKLIINAKDDGYRLGLATMKQQMLAKAVDGDITFDYYGDDDKTYGCIAHDSFCLEDFGLKDRDKVKVIVIKEE